MTDYSKMSDFEINKAVAEYDLDGDWLLEPTDDRRFTFFNLGVASKRTAKLPNYCNNPSDAWPIIFEGRIAIIPDSAAGEWVAFNEFTLYEGDWMFASDPARHVNGKNPLRAAMIVYLMMKESENA